MLECEMALDHYVSQAHLRNFYPDGKELLNAIRKSDQKRFPCRTESVCRIDEGSTNDYLTEPRAIEEFLKGVEPKYNQAVVRLREGKPTADDAYVIAGFAAYVATCSPAAMRMNSVPLRAAIEATAIVLDGSGQMPKAPDVLGNKSMSELLNDGTVKINVDEKYPQAVGISNIYGHLSILGNSEWEILRNSEEDSPFFTSDYPVAVEARKGSTFVNWIVPLAPDLAVRIKPDLALRGQPPDLTLKNFRFGTKQLKRSEVVDLNRLIVRSAEDCVFFKEEKDWVPGFIRKNSPYLVDSVITRVPKGNGVQVHASKRIVAKTKA